MNTLQPDAMTFHWEFTLGSDRVAELVEQLPFAALGQNIFDAEWDEPAELFPPYKMFERGGTKIAVIGQAFPYMPIANPGWMFPEYAFGIRDENMAAMVAEVRAATMALMLIRKWPALCQASMSFCLVTLTTLCQRLHLLGKRLSCRPVLTGSLSVALT